MATTEPFATHPCEVGQVRRVEVHVQVRLVVVMTVLGENVARAKNTRARKTGPREKQARAITRAPPSSRCTHRRARTRRTHWAHLTASRRPRDGLATASWHSSASGPRPRACATLCQPSCGSKHARDPGFYHQLTSGLPNVYEQGFPPYRTPQQVPPPRAKTNPGAQSQVWSPRALQKTGAPAILPQQRHSRGMPHARARAPSVRALLIFDYMSALSSRTRIGLPRTPHRASEPAATLRDGGL